MKKFIMIFVVLLSLGLIFWSCSDDGGTSPNPDENTLNCAITTPLDSTGFYAGDSISVIANADDTDGTVIQVRFLIDDNGVSADDVFPYTAKIPTSLLTVGTHTIKAIAENDAGKEVSSSVNIGIIPNPPTNLTVTQQNVYTFSLSWSDNSTGEDGFKVERKIDDGEFVDIVQTTENTYIDSTVMKKGFGTVYYQVKAYKEIYNSSYTENHATVGFPAPSSLTNTKENLSTIRLNWNDNSTGEDGFKIDKKIGVNDWVIGFASVEENIKTWTDSNADINESISYRIYAYKGTNTSGTAQNNITNTFPAPTNLTVDQTTVTSATISWVDNSIGEDKFEIERKLATETDYIKIAEVTGSDTPSKIWIDATVPNSTYNYRVKAKYSSFESNYVLNTFDNTFPAPTSLNIAQQSITSALLTWLDNSNGEDKFDIERKLSSETTYTKIAEVTGDDNPSKSFNDQTIEPDKTYDYRIKAVISTYSSEYISKLNFNNPFYAPSNLVVEQNNVYTFTLNWTDNSEGEDGFKIERKIDDGSFIEISSTTNTSYIDSTVSKKGYGNVYYQVRAYKNNFYTAYIDNYSSVDFPAPSDITFIQENIYSIRLDWIDNSNGEGGFKIDKKIGNSEWVLGFATVNENIETWTDSNADINENLEYRVYAYKGSNSTSSVTTSTIDNTFPAPTKLTSIVKSNSEIQLDWIDNSIGENGFYIDKKINESGEWILNFITLTPNTTSWIDTDISLVNSYYYRIRGYYSSSYSDYCEAMCTTELTFEKTFGDIDIDEGKTVIQSFDSNYLAVGYSKSNITGDYDGWLIKYDQYGNIMWDKTFGGQYDDKFITIIEDSNNNYLILGSTSSYGAGSSDIWLIKIDPEGNILWEKTYGGPDPDYVIGINSIIETIDGSYAVVGQTQSYDSGNYSDVWLIKIDSNGNLVWNKTFGGSYHDGGSCIKQQVSGEYILAGSTYVSGFNSIYLIKTDQNGNLLWDKSFGAADSTYYGKDLIETSDGGIMVLGNGPCFDSKPYGDIYLLKTDSLGNKIWDQYYGGTDLEGCSNIVKTSDNNYIISGITTSYGSGKYDGWLVKVNETGNKIWDKTFGGIEDEYLFCTNETSDNYLIITGSSRSYGNGLNDLYLIKTDLDGNVK